MKNAKHLINPQVYTVQESYLNRATPIHHQCVNPVGCME